MNRIEKVERRGVKRKKTPLQWRWLFLLFGIVGALWFSIPLIAQVYNAGGILAFVFFLCCGVGACLFPSINRRVSFSKAVKKGIKSMFALCMIAGVLWTIFLSSCMVYGMKAAPEEEGEPYTVIVLGSKVNGTVPSADLWQRILTAEAYLKAHPESKAIASGGQGRGEELPEGEAIRDALVELGIDRERVFVEAESTNTQENIAFSMEIARREGLSERIALVTDEYHQFRAGKTAASMGIEATAVCAATPWYVFPAAWARELLALTKWFVFG